MSLSGGQVPRSISDLAAVAEGCLPERPHWSPAHRQSTANIAAYLANDVEQSDCRLVGLSGAPGCGKSTLAQVIALLLGYMGRPCVTLSLDDYYLTLEERQNLAQQKHPLFRQRGVPGTHDWEGLIGDLDKILTGEIDGLSLPRFDKSSDDRVRPERFRHLDEMPSVVIFEGWLIGAGPEEFDGLQRPVNALEAEQDPECDWRRQVNEYLATYHRDLVQRLDRLWFLAAPDWNSVVEWRMQQENDNTSNGRPHHLPDRAAVVRFLQPFQRIALNMLSECGDTADIVVRINRNHQMSVE
jgi:D-glycerate 3-kinase